MPLSLIIMYIIIILIIMYISCPCCKLCIYLVMLVFDYLLLDSLKKISTGSWFFIKACNYDTSRISITSLQLKQLIFHKLFQILSISPTCKQVLWSGMLDGLICSLSGSLYSLQYSIILWPCTKTFSGKQVQLPNLSNL